MNKNEYTKKLIAETRKALSESANAELEAAKKEAQRISSAEGVAQHVNKISGGYKVEDWFDSDTTVCSYINGELKSNPSMNEASDDFEDEHPYIKDDGWNTEDDTIWDLREWCAEVEAVRYEIENSARGSYAIPGDTPQDLVDAVEQLINNGQDVLKMLQANLGEEDYNE